jgi:hypothetical protein
MNTLRRSTCALIISLAAMEPTVAAEIYTFGKGANGSRYVKHVDRPLAAKKARADAKEDSSGQSASDRQGESQTQPGSRTTSPKSAPPPPPLDSKSMELLNSPVM